jgi:hypothetical protein
VPAQAAASQHVQRSAAYTPYNVSNVLPAPQHRMPARNNRLKKQLHPSIHSSAAPVTSGADSPAYAADAAASCQQ